MRMSQKEVVEVAVELGLDESSGTGCVATGVVVAAVEVGETILSLSISVLVAVLEAVEEESSMIAGSEDVESAEPDPVDVGDELPLMAALQLLSSVPGCGAAGWLAAGWFPKSIFQENSSVTLLGGYDLSLDWK